MTLEEPDIPKRRFLARASVWRGEGKMSEILHSRTWKAWKNGGECSRNVITAQDSDSFISLSKCHRARLSTLNANLDFATCFSSLRKGSNHSCALAPMP